MTDYKRIEKEEIIETGIDKMISVQNELIDILVVIEQIEKYMKKYPTAVFYLLKNKIPPQNSFDREKWEKTRKPDDIIFTKTAIMMLEDLHNIKTSNK